MKNLIYLLIASVLIFNFSSCKKRVSGSVKIYGKIIDAYDNYGYTDIDLRLFQNQKNKSTEVAPDVKINADGTYEVNFVTNDVAQKGYDFEWTPNVLDDYYFDNEATSAYQFINDNECKVDITLRRTGHFKVRLQDVFPYDNIPYLEFRCDGNRYPVDLRTFSGDETFTTRLIPQRDNYYQLVSRAYNFTDTVIAGVVNMDLSGDTLYQTLQF
ncbi:MAG: hypothetical protein KA275_04600 [Chitinophagaceae bacterium]|nr:hypothetical protein [Chitinophagaceae bacterium]